MATLPGKFQRAHLAKAAVAGALCLGILASKVRALVSLDDGHDKIFVTGTATFAWDSNIYANSANEGDYVYSELVEIDYSRRAGLIGVDASVAVNNSNYAKNTGQSFRDPNLSLEFTKQTGRTTGSLRFSAVRENRADTDANLRTQAWTYDVGLNLSYPVIERYSLSGGVDVSTKRYDNNAELVNLNTYTANLDLYYIFSQERDLLTGFRIRQEDTSADSHADDFSYTVGVHGRILPKVNGTVRFGYEVRTVTGPGAGRFDSWTSSASITWNVTRRYQVSGTLSKDFNFTSMDASTDVLSGSLDSYYAFTARFNLGASVGAGDSHFLGSIGAGRHDTYFDYTLSLNYSVNDHLKGSVQYTYFRNWSSLAFADFVRNGYSLTLTSKW